MITQLLNCAVSSIKTRQVLILENFALRHQLGVLQRSGRRPRLSRWDRGLWVLLSCLWKSWRGALFIVQPATVVGWHRKGFRLYWKWKSGKPGRPRVPQETRTIIRRMSRENSTWGAPRIHGELLKLGIDLSEPTIAKYMVRTRKPPSQTWKTFLQNHMGETVAVDFLTVPTAPFKILYVFLILSHERRKIVHFNVTSSPTAVWAGRQLIQAFPWDTAPKYVLRDNDSIFGLEFRQAVKNLGMEEVKTARKSPWQNPYVERVIGSIRRECLDHMIIFGEKHLRKVLREYCDYYHESRTHLGLEKDCPEPRAVEPPELGKVVSIPQVGGLHHRYTRKAA